MSCKWKENDKIDLQHFVYLVEETHCVKNCYICSGSDADAIQVSAQLWGDEFVSRTVKKPVWGGVQKGVGGQQELRTQWGL